MPLIGVRELRQRLSDVLRKVREERAEYIITYQGRPTAILLPLDADRIEVELVSAGKRAVLGDWEAYERLAEELCQAWSAEQRTQDLMDAVRR